MTEVPTVTVAQIEEARRLLQQLPMTRSDAAAGQRPYAQDYPNQPYQQPGQQQGNQPVRPASWNDPYGQHGTPQQGAPAADAQPGQQADAPAQPAPSTMPACTGAASVSS